MYVGPILECTSGGASNVHLGIPRTYIRGSLQRTSEKHSAPYVRDFFKCAGGRGHRVPLVRIASELTPPPKFYTVHLYTSNLEAFIMTIHAQYTQARTKLASLLDEVTEHREVVIIKRRGHEDVAMISADELTGLLETAHLLRSPKNAARLLAALDKAQQGIGSSQTLDELRDEVHFEHNPQ